MLTEVAKEKSNEVGKALSDKIPDFSKPNNSSSIESKVPTFNLTAKEINNSPDLQDSEQSKIKEESNYSPNINESISSVDELTIYNNVPLEETKVNDKPALCRNDIDLDKQDDMGKTNLERMEKGRPPLDETGTPLELHHIGQEASSPLAELSQQEHRGVGNNTVLHDGTQDSKIDRAAFQKEKSEYWKARAEQLQTGNI
ncbi:HNH/ENDO VII family nuclease [Colwellia sp. BRX8-9]|nr:HNH/ENDO VII family nuclease [Colwellia sp. BRX8-9]